MVEVLGTMMGHRLPALFCFLPLLLLLGMGLYMVIREGEFLTLLAYFSIAILLLGIFALALYGTVLLGWQP